MERGGAIGVGEEEEFRWEFDLPRVERDEEYDRWVEEVFGRFDLDFESGDGDGGSRLSSQDEDGVGRSGNRYRVTGVGHGVYVGAPRDG
jgi:hypothetical protein